MLLGRRFDDLRLDYPQIDAPSRHEYVGPRLADRKNRLAVVRTCSIDDDALCLSETAR